jgi:hypothetical protein
MMFLRSATTRLLHQQVSKKTFAATYGSCRFLRAGLSTYANDEKAYLFHDENIGTLGIPSPDRADYRKKMATFDEQPLTSLLMELPDRVGVLHDVLRFFWKYDVNIRRIESRPSQFGKFDFFVDVEGGMMGDERDERLDNLRTSLKEFGVEKLLTLGEKEGKVGFNILFVVLNLFACKVSIGRHAALKSLTFQLRKLLSTYYY